VCQPILPTPARDLHRVRSEYSSDRVVSEKSIVLSWPCSLLNYSSRQYRKAVGAAVWLNENGIVLMGVGVLYMFFGFIPNAGTPPRPEARKREAKNEELNVFENVFELGTKPA